MYIRFHITSFSTENSLTLQAELAHFVHTQFMEITGGFERPI